MSLPLRECGLKSEQSIVLIDEVGVTPLAGVWIEIPQSPAAKIRVSSLPLRECGLKSDPCVQNDDSDVTPLAGVWIEI